ncbi:MAG: carboxyltransferase domain-containing protein, partial [Pseudomonadota bacterium]
PRPKVAAGSVGVIRGFTGVYPLEGPGGWPIVGQTDIPLFEAKADKPFALELGMTVRFEALT